LDAELFRHISFPSDARTPTPASAVKAMMVRTPPTSATIGEEYPAPSLSSLLTHTVLPDILSSATTPAPRPPGVTITWSPSMSGDSLSNQFGFSAFELLEDVALPDDIPSAARRHARSPVSLSA
jgi:hypothetical protein